MDKYNFLNARIKMFFQNHKSLTKAFHQSAEMFLKYALVNNLTYCRINLDNCHSTYLVISVKKETKDIFFGLYYFNTREVNKSLPVELFESELNYLKNHFHCIYDNIFSSLSGGKFDLRIS